MPATSATPSYLVLLEMADERPNLEEILGRCKNATPGPWRWSGHVRGDIYLATEHWGRINVLAFGRKGMNGAEPLFQEFTDRSGPTPFFWAGSMVRCRDRAIKEVPHRDDIVSIDNPDATFIAHARADLEAVTRYALELEERLAALETSE